MLQDSALRFSVEESVWFQRGQEVHELLSVTLDPDISIQEHDQYVSIKGALQLTGEYRISENHQSEEVFEYANVRYVNETETREDGITELKHRFPVDITIPKNRIPTLEEVYVTIETFDYEIPEKRCLKLLADLSISGVSRQQIEEIQAEEYTPEDHLLEKEQESPVYAQEEASYEEEPALYRAPIAEEEKEQAYQEIFMDDSERDDEENDLYTPFEVEVKKTPDTETVHFSNEQQEPASYNEDSEVHHFEEASEVHHYEEAREPSNKQTEPTIVFDKEDSSKQGIRQDENALYLTKIFAREDEEEFSRVKMCIVQQGETIDTICERYDITVQQLMRVNELTADRDVYEGLILYIPDYADLKS
ncbi:stage VI sporulation protein D [Metabacillus sp. RGM 3146]|uniref:stage VI sporulation protein D n=1 Tax=Metabacillus sp. RGM 3146 TaxID=3401092 RepID=UPI003B9D47DD